MFRFAGTLFGIRGLESRLDYLYVGTDGALHDARNEAATYEALSKMHDMATEGLISEAFINTEEVKTEKYLADDNGFMHYDYNQTQTAYNATVLDNAAGEKYMAVMVPVSRWNDGSEKYMRFTESWRSVKTDGWGISAAGVEGNQDKLYACLKLIDYAYSPDGQVLMSYGPDEFVKHDASGKVETFDFNGKQWPVISEKSYDDLWKLQNGNYTNYARYYIGSTLSFVKSQAFEYQCTHEVGKEGAGYISKAIALGTIKHPELALAENSWYTSIPTVLPQEVAEANAINELTQLSNKGQFGSAKEEVNLFVDII
jgi:putative aldouronate transport system substrate-binding protein